MVTSEQWSDYEMIRQPFPTYRQLHLIRLIKFYISIGEFIIIIMVWSGGAKITSGRANIKGALSSGVSSALLSLSINQSTNQLIYWSHQSFNDQFVHRAINQSLPQKLLINLSNHIHFSLSEVQNSNITHNYQFIAFNISAMLGTCLNMCPKQTLLLPNKLYHYSITSNEVLWRLMFLQLSFFLLQRLNIWDWTSI